MHFILPMCLYWNVFCKSIFLWPSVGYSTCHWCHVMERESFEDEEIGKILSDNFVCIKVDREERPDVDKVYMTFVQVCVQPMFSYILVFSHNPLLFIFSLMVLSHDFWLLTPTGNKWRWRLAHECVVDPWPSTFHWRHVLPSQRSWKKTWDQNGCHENHGTGKRGLGLNICGKRFFFLFLSIWALQILFYVFLWSI